MARQKIPIAKKQVELRSRIPRIVHPKRTGGGKIGDLQRLHMPIKVGDISPAVQALTIGSVPENKPIACGVSVGESRRVYSGIQALGGAVAKKNNLRGLRHPNRG